MSASYKYESATIIRVVTILGVVACLCVSAIAGLAWTHHDIPDALASVAGGAVGALATLLATYLPSPVPGGHRATDAVLPSSPTISGPSAARDSAGSEPLLPPPP